MKSSKNLKDHLVITLKITPQVLDFIIWKYLSSHEKKTNSTNSYRNIGPTQLLNYHWNSSGIDYYQKLKYQSSEP